MAIGTSVPPRAYTRDILTTAFTWLQTQPDAVRAKATTPDALVGLYTQAQRVGANKSDSSFETEAPVSSQSFMSDLKNLAEGLKEFDDSRAHRQYSAPAQNYSNPQNDRAVTAPAGAPLGATAIPAATTAAPAQTASQQTSAPTGPAMQRLNERSLAMLREIQSAMNLSSEIEALNMAVAVALDLSKQSPGLYRALQLFGYDLEERSAALDFFRTEKIRHFADRHPPLEGVECVSFVGAATKNQLSLPLRLIYSKLHESNELSDGLIAAESQEWARIGGVFELDHFAQLGAFLHVRSRVREHAKREFERLILSVKTVIETTSTSSDAT